MGRQQRPRLSGLFWNVKRRSGCEPLIATMVKTYGVDLLVLAEYDTSEDLLLGHIDQSGVRRYRADQLTAHSLRLFYRLPSVTPVFDDGHLSIRHIRLPRSIELLVVAAHLPSKLYCTPEDQTEYAVQYAGEITKAERDTGINKTILVGDLNMNPFERGVLHHNAFHGIMNRQDAVRQRSRVVNGRVREYFYNPSWRMFTNGLLAPSGTYWYGESGPVAQFWHVFDQVLVRPSLIDAFEERRFDVVSIVGKQSLLKQMTGRPSTSDHLPIRFMLSF
jgi:hypothetical protein